MGPEVAAKVIHDELMTQDMAPNASLKAESLPKARIVVCDDEPAIVRLLQANLQASGYEVITASDGFDCLHQVRSNTPDMLVVDVMMPYMDGMEVVRRLRREQATQSLPVIMLTSKSQDDDYTDAYRSGVDLYLTKPFNPIEFLTFVNRILEA